MLRKAYHLPVVISVYEDKSFTFVVKISTCSSSYKKGLRDIEKGSGEPNKVKVGNNFPKTT